MHTDLCDRVRLNNHFEAFECENAVVCDYFTSKDPRVSPEVLIRKEEDSSYGIVFITVNSSFLIQNCHI